MMSLGAISIDGQNIKDLKIQSLRSLMGNVNQDPILFNDTIYNNIAFGVENATMEDVVAAAKSPMLTNLFWRRKMDTRPISGPRNQALGRPEAAHKHCPRHLEESPILILDEATAALDTQSERLVQEALERLMSKRTTIAIAHRLSTIKDADEIIVVEAGRIVERGGHDELIEKNGYYKNFTTCRLYEEHKYHTFTHPVLPLSGRCGIRLLYETGQAAGRSKTF